METKYKAIVPRIVATKKLYDILKVRLSRKLRLEPYSDIMLSIRLYIAKDTYVTVAHGPIDDTIAVFTSSTSHVFSTVDRVVSFAKVLRRGYKEEKRKLQPHKHRNHRSRGKHNKRLSLYDIDTIREVLGDECMPSAIPIRGALKHPPKDTQSDTKKYIDGPQT